MEKIICFVDPPKQYSAERWANDGTVLSAEGQAVQFELSQQGRYLFDWCLLNRTPEGYTGLLVWEGRCDNLWSMHHGADWDPSLIGSWRLPTSEELAGLVGQLQAA